MRSCSRDGRPCQNSSSTARVDSRPSAAVAECRPRRRVAHLRGGVSCLRARAARRSVRSAATPRRRGARRAAGWRNTRRTRRAPTFAIVALDANLSLELGPEEEQRGVATRRELAALPARVVGEEDEPAARRSPSAARRARTGRPSASAVASVIALGSGIVRLDRLVEPALELAERMRRDARFVQRLALVVDAQVGDLQGGEIGRERRMLRQPSFYAIARVSAGRNGRAIGEALGPAYGMNFFS